jgi:hypothetical protein
MKPARSEALALLEEGILRATEIGFITFTKLTQLNFFRRFVIENNTKICHSLCTSGTTKLLVNCDSIARKTSNPYKADIRVINSLPITTGRSRSGK